MIIYGVCLEIQQKLIDKYCFNEKECGHILIGGIITDYGSFFPCKIEDCKYEEKRTEILGTLESNGNEFCVRKLIEDEEKGSA